MKHAQCNCETRSPATVRVTYPVRVWGSTEMRTGYFCKRCADAMREPEAQPTPDPYSREASIGNIDRLTAEMVDAVERWTHRNPENFQAASDIGGELLCISRALRAELANVADHNDRERNRTR